MSGIVEWLNGLSVHWWQYVVQMSWQAAWVGVILLAGVQFLGRRWPAPLRYALLVLALIKFACPPFLPVPTGLFTNVVELRTSLPVPPRASVAIAQSASWLPAALGEARLGQWTGLRWTTCLMLLHTLGSGILAAVLIRQATQVRKVVRASRVLMGGTVYRDAFLDLECARIPPLFASDQIEGPMAFGFTKPAIILPAQLPEALSPAELKTVLAHELAHCKRGDLWLNWLQLGLLALWWFHPVLWLINRSLREVREDCCDDLLLFRRVVGNDHYCDVLLRAAAQLSRSFQFETALGLGRRMHSLARRLVRISDSTLRRSEKLSRVSAAGVLLAAALLLPGVQTPEVITVDNRPVPTGASVQPEERPQLLPEKTEAPRLAAVVAMPKVTAEQSPRLLPRQAMATASVSPVRPYARPMPSTNPHQQHVPSMKVAFPPPGTEAIRPGFVGILGPPLPGQIIGQPQARRPGSRVIVTTRSIVYTAL